MAKAGRTYVNQSVSFHPLLLQRARDRAERLGLPFSTYVQKCVEFDLEKGGPIAFTEREPTPPEAVAAEKPAEYDPTSVTQRKRRRKP